MCGVCVCFVFGRQNKSAPGFALSQFEVEVQLFGLVSQNFLHFGGVERALVAALAVKATQGRLAVHVDSFHSVTAEHLLVRVGTQNVI